MIAGLCERCGSVVTKRLLTQWYFKITDYAQRLLDDMDDIVGGWPERGLTMQRNWIGRSEGAWVDFMIENRAEPVRVFTTRPHPVRGDVLRDRTDAPLAAEVVSHARARRLRSIWSRPSTRPRSSGRPPTGPRPACSWVCMPQIR